MIQTENNFSKLSELKVGQKGRVVAVRVEDKSIRRHLLDMGLVRGTVVEIKKIAPMGDPIDIFLRNYELCIRKADLSYIDVEVVK